MTQQIPISEDMRTHNVKQLVMGSVEKEYPLLWRYQNVVLHHFQQKITANEITFTFDSLKI